MGNVMENGNKKEKVITRMAAYDWLKVMGTLMVVIGHYYAMFPNGSQLPLWSSGNFSGIGCKWWICYHIFLRSFRIHVDEALL